MLSEIVYDLCYDKFQPLFYFSRTGIIFLPMEIIVESDFR